MSRINNFETRYNEENVLPFELIWVDDTKTENTLANLMLKNNVNYYLMPTSLSKINPNAGDFSFDMIANYFEEEVDFSDPKVKLILFQTEFTWNSFRIVNELYALTANNPLAEILLIDSNDIVNKNPALRSYMVQLGLLQNILFVKNLDEDVAFILDSIDTRLALKTRSFLAWKAIAEQKANANSELIKLETSIRPKELPPQIGKLYINWEWKTTENGDSDLKGLTRQEFDCLHYLAVRANTPVSKEDLIKNVWGYEIFGGSNMVEVAMRRLRMKIEENPSKPVILKTERGIGYTLVI